MKRTPRSLLFAALLLGARMAAAEPHPGPQNIAASPDGKTLYVAAMTAKQIVFVDAEKAAVARKTDLPMSPSGMVLSPERSALFVAHRALRCREDARGSCEDPHRRKPRRSR